MTTTHTPGPMEQWAIDHAVSVVTGQPTRDGRGLVCFDGIEAELVFDFAREQDAIRAELLEALEAVLATVEFVCDNGGGADGYSAILNLEEPLRAAVSKARGA